MSLIPMLTTCLLMEMMDTKCPWVPMAVLGGDGEPAQDCQQVEGML